MRVSTSPLLSLVLLRALWSSQQDPLSAFNKRAYGQVKDWVLRSAEKMPEENYSYNQRMRRANRYRHRGSKLDEHAGEGDARKRIRGCDASRSHDLRHQRGWFVILLHQFARWNRRRDHEPLNTSPLPTLEGTAVSESQTWESCGGRHLTSLHIV